MAAMAQCARSRSLDERLCHYFQIAVSALHMDCRVAMMVNSVAPSSFAVMDAGNSLLQKEAGNFRQVIECASRLPAAAVLGNERGTRILRVFTGETPVPLLHQGAFGK